MRDPVALELRRQLARMEAAERRMSMMLIPGKVGPVDPERRRLRLKLGKNSKGEDVLGPWTRWQEAGVGQLSIHSEPGGDEQMMLISLSGTVGAGSIAIPATFDQDHAAPSKASDLSMFARGQTRIEMKGDQLVFRAGGCTAVLDAAGWQTLGGGVFHDDVQIGKDHVHEDVEPGGALSGKPPR
ncbi:phage baseplate assembly protein V [Shinella zoogloeoides]|uniref:Phage baseplate protein n=1 Tax=Shinella zoogloeoides TaxID=352475 RepID=A0A6N8T825_SHIZO|nr:phage baseplate assembly protein V [Shinella zoogloeoides]MXN99441.1 phage baseplate protein [Shinella zoogloeoides]MXO01581.1 phage baseplate protein [Shinella zoogloeoides]UEX80181.1 phage baseplate assembly protein V [Shinella zoogloeoides]UEX82780.1 phage baseplate assembly protein V [Shinella zoogloeoides]